MVDELAGNAVAAGEERHLQRVQRQVGLLRWSATCQPTILRENRSVTNAVYTKPQAQDS